MTCPNCGTENEKGNHFCKACGTRLDEDGNGRKEKKTQPGRPRVDPDIFIHDLDRAALNSLKKIPGFTAVLKAFMKVWNERQFRITNMSSRIRLDENQMSRYYDMLGPICEKLDIAVPDLYLELDVKPNAYTQGDTEPFIVMTSGLLDCMQDELIPSVLAHECGHIACHHVLYHTMGSMILNGFNFMTGATPLVSKPLQWGFAYWMRCSEFSADRAAVLCDGSPENMIRMCACFSGYNKNFDVEMDMDAFMEQAKEYNALVKSSAWDKAMEFYLYNQNDHPLTAVRAYECNEWSHTKQFERALHYLNHDYSV